MNLNVDHHTPQGESVAKHETLLLITLSLLCKSDIQEVQGNMSNIRYAQTNKRTFSKLHPCEYQGNIDVAILGNLISCIISTINIYAMKCYVTRNINMHMCFITFIGIDIT